MTSDKLEGDESHQMPGRPMNGAEVGTGGLKGPSRSDIAKAVAERLQSQATDASSSNDDSKLQIQHKAKIRKLINELTASVNYEKASACLRLTYTLLANILQHPTESKYRAFKATQPKIAREILALEEGKALLVEIGFRTRTQDFQQEWFIPAEWKEQSLGMKKIQWSRELVNTKMQEFEENAERVRFNKEREKTFESNRKSRALDEAREDRERVALRAERERVSRRAAEARAEAEKEAERLKQIEMDEAEKDQAVMTS